MNPFNGSAAKLSLRKPVILGGAVLVLATLLAYLPALPGAFIWDDDAYVTNNPLLTAPDGLTRIWFSAHSQSQYFPLVFTTLRFERALWGLNPFGYHLVNVLLHGLNAVLAWAVLRRLAVPGAWFAAAIFALHPVQVETAAWITELKNTESAFFFLLALLAWIKFIGRDTARPWRFYALAILLYALALFSKTTACTLPAAMVLVLWLRKESLNLPRVLQVAPFVLLGVGMGLVSVWWEGHLGNFKEKFGLAFSLPERFLIATRAIWFYLGKLIWPADLTFSYPRWTIDPRDPAQYVWAAAGVAVAVFLWRKRRTLDRGVMAAAVFFVALLSPLLGFFPLYTFYYTFVADHYQYLACLGPIALFAAGGFRLFARWRTHPLMQSAVAGLLLGVLGVLTWQQAGAYQNLESLWRDTLKKNPASWMAHSNLGMVLAARGDRVEAETHYRESLRLKPDHGDAHYNLANLLLATGRKAEALAHYQQAAQFSPDDADIHNNLGVALHAAGRTDDAVEQFHQALALKPDLAGAHYNLGVALEVQQQRDAAILEYREVLRLQPASAAAQARLRALGAPLTE